MSDTHAHTHTFQGHLPVKCIGGREGVSEEVNHPGGGLHRTPLSPQQAGDIHTVLSLSSQDNLKLCEHYQKAKGIQ